MSKESAEDYGELPDELLATPRLLANFYRSFKICIKMRLCSKQAQAHFIGNAVTYNYRKMYFRMNSTVRTYISGVIFFP